MMDIIPVEARLRVAALSRERGDLIGAEAEYRAVLMLDPQNATALNGLGVLLLELGRNEESEALLRRCVAVAPDYAAAHSNLGLVLTTRGKKQEACEAYADAVRLAPYVADLHFNLGDALRKCDRLEEAGESLRRAALLAPDDAEILSALGDVERLLEHFEEAAALFRRVLSKVPGNVAIMINLGVSCMELGRYRQALSLFEQAIVLAPDMATAYANLGSALLAMERCDDALSALDKALALDPSSALSLASKGVVYNHMKKWDEAEKMAREAICCDPNYHEAFSLLGEVLGAKGDEIGSIDAYQRANSLFPGKHLVALAYGRRKLCDWRDWREWEAEALKSVSIGREHISPFAFLSFPTSMKDQQTVAGRWLSIHVKGVSPMTLPAGREDHRKIRLGYLSADFHNHPVTRLMLEVLTLHDRSSFDVIAYSYGREKDDPMRKSVEESVDRFIDISALSDEDAAKTIAKDEIDVLIDLSGSCMQNGRPALLARRPAPAIVSYLGYPGSMGVDFYDYVIGDSYLTPTSDQPFYSEKIIQLADCYQPGDRRRKIQNLDRKEAGLPEKGPLLAAFNNCYKITPPIFSAWMGLLRANSEAILWMTAPNIFVRANLQKEAEARGVSSDRLYFAEWAPNEVYLGRLALADLFLDCYPFNAGATANDVLWAGTPILTLSGESYVSRMAGSLLLTLGLPELVAASLEDYEERGRKLLADPEKLFGLREKIARQKKTSPLFDSERTTRNLESAYRRVQEATRGVSFTHKNQ